MRQVDVEPLAEAEDEDQHVGEFVCDLAAARGIGEQFLHILVRLEAKVLEQLGGFGRDPDREVLGAVELVPVARLAERADETLQLNNGGVVVRRQGSALVRRDSWIRFDPGGFVRPVVRALLLDSGRSGWGISGFCTRSPPDRAVYSSIPGERLLCRAFTAPETRVGHRRSTDSPCGAGGGKGEATGSANSGLGDDPQRTGRPTRSVALCGFPPSIGSNEGLPLRSPHPLPQDPPLDRQPCIVPRMPLASPPEQHVQHP